MLAAVKRRSYILCSLSTMQTTTTTPLFVNSAFRNKLTFPDPASFTVRLAKPVRNVTGLVVRDFYLTKPNVAEYLVLHIKQVANFGVTNVAESAVLASSPYQMPSSAVHVEECAAKCALSPRSPRYPNAPVAAVCSDLSRSPVPTLSQLDFEVWGRPAVAHAAPPLTEPVPYALFPFGNYAPGCEWGCVIEITHSLR